MTATYDPDLIDRLVREARNADMLDSFREFGDSYLIKTKHGEYGTYDVVLALERAHAMAYQLDAARREVDSLELECEAIDRGEDHLRQTVAQQADQLEAARSEVAECRKQFVANALEHDRVREKFTDELAMLLPVIEAAEIVCGPDLTGTERMDLVFDTLMPAIDAYRAAKDKT